MSQLLLFLFYLGKLKNLDLTKEQLDFLMKGDNFEKCIALFYQYFEDKKKEKSVESNVVDDKNTVQFIEKLKIKLFKHFYDHIIPSYLRSVQINPTIKIKNEILFKYLFNLYE